MLSGNNYIISSYIYQYGFHLKIKTILVLVQESLENVKASI
ncbi:Uncharacterised protein [Weeksella virosa]|uniref:Uncharacterized protein n=1 Tax=Weeksella virosa (strain ATCC 43766 / DSM 16922 / JCM 21250 / CCUG 30538 / CDC 9751 / IAM 14551 / NBRC 16016 / NCTC 11634 / CL345/78) TaxID=865938 RepID=F0P0M7_WEEVC|nr:hypothetical protein Weevi_1837 [Weeksella virosa DSM 16922]VEH63816.1 Uncharacterised protein [Weeksella virosa]